MAEKQNELRQRTKLFALAVTRFARGLPETIGGRWVRSQLFRAATSVAANYRSAQRGRSDAEFVAKLGVATEEADESGFWLEFAALADLARPESVQPLMREADELVRILVSSQVTVKRRM